MFDQGKNIHAGSREESEVASFFVFTPILFPVPQIIFNNPRSSILRGSVPASKIYVCLYFKSTFDAWHIKHISQGERKTKTRSTRTTEAQLSKTT